MNQNLKNTNFPKLNLNKNYNRLKLKKYQMYLSHDIKSEIICPFPRDSSLLKYLNPCSNDSMISSTL